MSFKNITVEEYKKSINNKNRIYDLTFKSPEILNKYRDDKNIYNEIKQNEIKKEKMKDYDKVFHDNLDKYFIENEDKKKIDEVSRYNHNIIKKQEKQLEQMNNELEDRDNNIKNFKNEYIRNT